MEQKNINVRELVARMPDADEPGKPAKFTGPDPAAAEAVFREILAGGPAAIRELVSAVSDPTAGGSVDFRAEYVLHGIAVFVGRPDQAESRRVFEEALIEELRQDRSPWMRALLIRELQFAGTQRVAAAIGQYLLDADEQHHPVIEQYLVVGHLAVAHVSAGHRRRRHAHRVRRRPRAVRPGNASCNITCGLRCGWRQPSWPIPSAG